MRVNLEAGERVPVPPIDGFTSTSTPALIRCGALSLRWNCLAVGSRCSITKTVQATRASRGGAQIEYEDEDPKIDATFAASTKSPPVAGWACHPVVHAKGSKGPAVERRVSPPISIRVPSGSEVALPHGRRQAVIGLDRPLAHGSRRGI